MHEWRLLPNGGCRPGLRVRLTVPELRCLIPPWELLRLLQLLLLGGQIRCGLRGHLLLDREQISHLCLDAVAELPRSIP
jgi:hypothetical protein